MEFELMSITSYYAGEIKKNGKRYPFTIICNEDHLIGLSEIAEITWTDEMPPNYSELEMQIKDEFINHQNKLHPSLHPSWRV